MAETLLTKKYSLNCNFLKPERLELNSKAVISYVSSKEIIAEDFWTAIKALQSEDTKLLRTSNEPELIWCEFSNDNLGKALINLMRLSSNDTLTDERVFSKAEIESITPKIKQALKLLEEIFPEIYPYFKLINPFLI